MINSCDNFLRDIVHSGPLVVLYASRKSAVSCLFCAACRQIHSMAVPQSNGSLVCVNVGIVGGTIR